MVNISADYIRGLIDGEGCFTFCSVPRKNSSGKNFKYPAFVIQLHERDKELLEKVRDFLKVKAKINILKAYLKDGYNRGKTARLMVREFSDLRDRVIPLFYGKLIGYKGKQLIEWLEKIGIDPDIYPGYKALYFLYKNGHFNTF